ncbi:hypothetical protein GCK72_000259 [Caenorhabditis remanei]|uniref:Protein-tyrosine-phosphatase n=1 Tax=Caenorhabditis remanei TaxID=31234 RepID=A0A6A5HQ63_CAERE|nr:hypothetical protein GCK72_000259 [Caenorhabditis remanei]KAF1768447.1 hypothetical protein GCK72_000259 [Caenorhabditis remanei]
MKKITRALVVLCLLSGNNANESNVRLGVNANYLKDSISPGIDPPRYSSDPPPSLDPTSNFHPPPSPSDNDSPLSQYSPHIRSTRNANDKLADYLKHTTIVVHLVNGIALQNGLMNGKMTSNDVAAELLNFGSIPVSTIANFKKDSVVAVTTQLKKIHPTLDSSVADMEGQALKWNELISKSGGLENVKNLPGSPEYFSEVGNFTSFDFTVFSQPSDELKMTGTSLTAISDTLNVFKKTNNFMSVYSKCVTFNREFNETLNNIDKYKQDMEKISTYTQLQKGPAILEPLKRLINAIEFRNSFTLDLKSDAQVTKNIEQVLSLVKYSQSAQNEILNMHKLVESRASPGSTNRKHTIGFPNGLNDVTQLVKDVRDPWIGKMINVKGSNLNDLTDGLEPLFNFQKTLSIVDEKLKPISADDIRDALSSLSPLQQELAQLKPDSVTLVSNLFQNLVSCEEKNIRESEYGPIKTFIGHVKTLATAHESTELALAGLDSTKVREEMNGLIASLGFKNFGDDSNAEREIKAVVEKLKKHDTLKDMKELLERVKQRFDGIPVKDMQTSAAYIVKNQNGITSFTGIDTELKVYACIQQFKSDSVIVSQSIKVIQSLRALDPQKIAKVESAATTVSEAASGLSGVASIQEKMKKNAREAAVELNKLPDASNKSVVIGQSVDSLNAAVTLRDLESQIGQLNSFDALVQVEIQKISIAADRSVVVKQWGNHKKDIDQLEKTLAGIQSFDSKLNVSNATTLGDYGRPLGNLALLTTVSMNAKEKLKALETLALTADSKDKPVIEKSQKTLEQLANLDLGFASHSAQYKSAPPAFQALHDFLSKFLAIPHNQQQSQNSWSIPDEYYGYGSGGLLIIIAIAGVSVYYLRKYIHKSRIRVWLKENDMNDQYLGLEMHKTVINAVENADKPLTWGTEKWVDYDKRRDPAISCNPFTGVILENDLCIHATEFTTALKKLVFIATQAPMKKRTYLREIFDEEMQEVVKLSLTEDADTTEDFWLMVMTKGTEYVVSLLTDKQMEKLECHYYPDTTKTPLACGRFTVKMESESLIFDGSVKQRNLAIEDNSKKLATRKLEHLQILDGEAEVIAFNIKTHFAVMARVKKSKKPIVVHCSDGTEATISFIGLQYIYEEVKKHPHRKFQDIVVEMCKRRWNGMKRYIQSAWLLVGVRGQLLAEYVYNNKKNISFFDHALSGMSDLVYQQIYDDKTKMTTALKTWSWENKGDAAVHFATHSRMLEQSRVTTADVKKAQAYLPVSKQRFPEIYCNPSTAVELEEDGRKILIHANTVKSTAKYPTEFIATQAPTDKRTPGKDDTCEDFWLMVFLKNSDYIVTLMSDEELTTKCGAYFHPEEKRSATCGRFTATTQSVKEFNYGVKERKLEVIDNNSKEKEKRVVTQYQYHTWDDKDVYEDKEALMGIMKVVNKSENPVIVHCEDGVSRTGVFIGLQFIYEEIVHQPKMTIQEVMARLRNQRWHAVPSVSQSFCLLVGVINRFANKPFQIKYTIPRNLAELIPKVKELEENAARQPAGGGEPEEFDDEQESAREAPEESARPEYMAIEIEEGVN